jgi:hypothetical protein
MQVCRQIVPAKMENPNNEDIIIQIEETLHLFLWPNNITTCFPFPSDILKQNSFNHNVDWNI